MISFEEIKQKFNFIKLENEIHRKELINKLNLSLREQEIFNNKELKGINYYEELNLFYMVLDDKYKGTRYEFIKYDMAVYSFDEKQIIKSVIEDKIEEITKNKISKTINNF